MSGVRVLGCSEALQRCEGLQWEWSVGVAVEWSEVRVLVLQWSDASRVQRIGVVCECVRLRAWGVACVHLCLCPCSKGNMAVSFPLEAAAAPPLVVDPRRLVPHLSADTRVRARLSPTHGAVSPTMGALGPVPASLAASAASLPGASGA